MSNNKQNAIEALATYKANEENNNHAENYLLLAEFYEDSEAIEKAQANIDFREWHNYADHDLSRAAHDACNSYYYILVEEVKDVENFAKDAIHELTPAGRKEYLNGTPEEQLKLLTQAVERAHIRKMKLTAKLLDKDSQERKELEAFLTSELDKEDVNKPGPFE